MNRIFSTRQRVIILRSTIFNRGNVSVSNTAKKTGLSKGLVSKYFDILLKKGVLASADGKLYVSDSPITKGIKILLNIETIDVKMITEFPFVEALGLYGSCARGENTSDSDMDIWIRVKASSDEELASLSSRIREAHENSRTIYLTEDKIRRMKKEDELFYHSLVFGSIVLFGDSYGVQI